MFFFGQQRSGLQRKFASANLVGRVANYIFLGGHSEGVTPVPISNTEVKPFSVDGTALVTEWESRTLPRFFFGNFDSCKVRKGSVNPSLFYFVRQAWREATGVAHQRCT